MFLYSISPQILLFISLTPWGVPLFLPSRIPAILSPFFPLQPLHLLLALLLIPPAAIPSVLLFTLHATLAMHTQAPRGAAPLRALRSAPNLALSQREAVAVRCLSAPTLLEDDLPRGGGTMRPPVQLYTLGWMVSTLRLFPDSLASIIRRLKMRTPLPPPTMQDQAAPSRPLHRTEFVLVLPDGTLGSLLVGQLSAGLMGGLIQIATQISDNDFKIRPLWTSTAILVATILAVSWHWLWEPVRDIFCMNLQLSTALPSWIQRTWKRLYYTLLISLMTGGWIWVLVYTLMMSGSRPGLQLRILVAMMVEASVWITNLLVPLLEKLRRRLRGRHESSIVELQGSSSR